MKTWDHSKYAYSGKKQAEYCYTLQLPSPNETNLCDSITTSRRETVPSFTGVCWCVCSVPRRFITVCVLWLLSTAVYTVPPKGPLMGIPWQSTISPERARLQSLVRELRSYKPNTAAVKKKKKKKKSLVLPFYSQSHLSSPLPLEAPGKH